MKWKVGGKNVFSTFHFSFYQRPPIYDIFLKISTVLCNNITFLSFLITNSSFSLNFAT